MLSNFQNLVRKGLDMTKLLTKIIRGGLLKKNGG